MRVAAPVCVAMLVVDLSLGMLGKTIPSLNLLSVGLSIRALVGITVVITGISMTGVLFGRAMSDAIDLTRLVFVGG
jgi:flagellar biosynthesis protein FliR